jgi:hypothetical protein
MPRPERFSSLLQRKTPLSRKLLSDINVYIKLDLVQAAATWQADHQRPGGRSFALASFVFCQSKFSIVATLSYSYGENVLYRAN